MFTKLIAWKEAYLKDEDGATAIEYGLIAAGIAVAIAAVLVLTGESLEALFTEVNDNLDTSS